MTTAEWIIMVILAVTLFVFLIVAIILGIKLIDLSKEIKKITIKGQNIADKTGDVELSVGVSTLAVAYIPSVNPYRRGTVHTVEVEEDALVSPALGQGEGTAVEACGIVILNAIVRPTFAGEGRIVVERIAHVGIHRCAEACHLPRKGHSDGVPIGVVQASGIELA